MIRGARRTKGRKSATRVNVARRRLNPAIWLLRHFQVALATLGRLTRNPIGTVMTAAVIGIAVALPAGLYLLIKNAETLSGAWNESVSISLYLDTEVDDAAARQLAEQFRTEYGVGEVKLVTRAEALQEFRALSGFAEALDLLDKNPLPAVILVQPTDAQSTPEQAQALADRLGAAAEVELAQLDLQWMQRLHAFTQAMQRGVLLLAGLLAAAVTLVVGNTIRLEIQHRQAEITITQLVGATDAFVRRPFLYTGLWFGLLGGLIAWVLVSGGLWLLQGPMARLADLYEGQFQLVTQSPTVLCAVFLGSPLLGLAGAWLAVNRQLARIKPE